MAAARIVVLAGLRAGCRGFHSTARTLAAQNFTMPALSPTMTEGNITQWRVKEGDTFQAGDVLLEIETDKATMDVEAQDDGVVMKIFTSNNAKGISVGTRIAVMAETGDDISTLEIPTDTSTGASASAPAPTAFVAPAAPIPKKTSGPVAAGTKAKKDQTLLPSVLSLIHAHHIDKATVETIPATGPGGRITKGDVLAFVGAISADAPGRVKARFDTLSNLDLSNIKKAPKKEPKKAEEPKKNVRAEKPAEPVSLEVTLPVSLYKVLETQKKIRDTLGVNLSLSTFISRATEVANDELPVAKRAPTQDELFDAVIGVKSSVHKVSRGFYVPQVEAVGATQFASDPAKKLDIYDILAGKKIVSKRVAYAGSSNVEQNVFSLVVPEAEAERASVFLERVKVILEEETSRLVL